ncbi:MULTISPECIES: choline transporter [Kosakonia]|jgi:choline/glycine/proline betaine transport protein|uniref:High-affinity choline transporter BetT n=2 Tax=Enterobacteriaceae TaxID=543 RepID=A0A807LDU5_9ENTR|nr:MULTISPECIES: choline transporter [Kosakonia]ESS58033.1 transporter, betaine/carnitine/choline transporter family protein [Enterobacter cloacae S611]MDP9769991.1 choline/glycine/proline betaine transport protein [Atlantibacter hermannii]APZ04068.1 high-affinity choline transporter BetT [Kosakonia cowanii JCM 10956 = DSM 18146]MDF2623064.1 high-affinity choline transporter BetT [Kosakonia cowanii]MDH2913600.1 choline transporter [Kosakonia sp. HypNH10]
MINPPASEKDRINPVVFYTSAGLILTFSLVTILYSDLAAAWIQTTVNWVSSTFGWYYMLAATLYIVFVIYMACSRYGAIKLGPEQSKPEFSLLSWSAMLFAAGIGIDLMFFSVAEPVTQYMQPPEGAGQTMEAARQAMVWTLFHYGLTGWSMYALMGIALGYFSYRYNLPLTIRSALYPIFGKRINGPIGHTVDIAAVIGTIFGIATTLGIGVVQLNYGLKVLFDVPEGLTAQMALIVLSVVIATISVTSGVDKGIRILSELNVALALGLILFVLFMGKTDFLLNALVLNVGDYINRFMGMTLNTFAFDRPTQWMNSWTLFFWAWWVAWSPFVGLFLARISRGRTIREFVLGTLIIPFTFTLLWLSVFGNAALYEIIHGDAGFAQEVMAHAERGFYSLLAQYPAFKLSASVATITGLLFYVTSADSGSLVLGNFTSKLKDINSDAPNWLRIFWSVAIGVLTMGMLMTNGISALQNTTVIMGLPFSFVIFFVMAGLYKSLKVEDHRRASASRETAPYIPASNDRLSWKKRLSRLMNYPGTRYTQQMMETVIYPAMQDVAKELELRGARVTLESVPAEEDKPLGHLDLRVHLGEEQNFVYQVWPQQYSVPGFTYRARSGKSHYFRLETFLLEGSQGNDLMDYNKEQVIIDILDQYERHLNFIHLHREAPGANIVYPQT